MDLWQMPTAPFIAGDATSLDEPLIPPPPYHIHMAVRQQSSLRPPSPPPLYSVPAITSINRPTANASARYRSSEDGVRLVTEAERYSKHIVLGVFISIMNPLFGILALVFAAKAQEISHTSAARTRAARRYGYASLTLSILGPCVTAIIVIFVVICSRKSTYCDGYNVGEVCYRNRYKAYSCGINNCCVPNGFYLDSYCYYNALILTRLQTPPAKI